MCATEMNKKSPFISSWIRHLLSAYCVPDFVDSSGVSEWLSPPYSFPSELCANHHPEGRVTVRVSTPLYCLTTPVVGAQSVSSPGTGPHGCQALDEDDIRSHRCIGGSLLQTR